MDIQLSDMLAQGSVWRGAGAKVAQSGAAWPTGIHWLDQALAGGWTAGQVHEIQCAHWFTGELQVLQAVFAQAGAQQWPVFWVAPPALPYAPALGAVSGAKARHILLSPQTEADALWATETILQSYPSCVVLLWSLGLDSLASRRLQLSIQHQASLAFVLTTEQPAEARSYGTRLRQLSSGGQVQWHILKRHGGWPVKLPRQSLRPWGRYVGISDLTGFAG